MGLFNSAVDKILAMVGGSDGRTADSRRGDARQPTPQNVSTPSQRGAMGVSTPAARSAGVYANPKPVEMLDSIDHASDRHSPQAIDQRRLGTVLDSSRGEVATPAGTMPRASDDASTPGSIAPSYQTADGRTIRGGR